MAKTKATSKPCGSRAPSTRQPALPPKETLRPGDYVRVRPGVRDPDFKDIDIGGWTGRIEWIGGRRKRTGETPCTVTWDRRTRKALPPDLRARCEEEELEIGEAGLDLSALELVRSPDAPEPGSLDDLLEQVVSAEGWPDPQVVCSILAKGPEAIDPLREMVRLGSEDDQFTAAADLAAGLLGELRAASGIPDLLELLKRGAEDELDWTENALSTIDGVSPDSLATIIQDTALSPGRRETAIAIFENLCDDQPEAEESLTAALISVLTQLIDRARDLTIADVGFASRMVFSLCWLAAPEAEPLIEAALKADIIDPDAVRQGRRAAKKRERDRDRAESPTPFLELYTESYNSDDDEWDEEEGEPGDEDEDEPDEDEWEQDEDPGIVDEDAEESVGQEEERPVPQPKVGRNDPCPCGSGKKFKKCCLGKTAAPPSKAHSPSSPPPEWRVEVELPPAKIPKPGTVELHPAVPKDLRRRLEQARQESIALLRAMDRAMVYLSEDEFSPELRAVFELEADCAEALWGLDQPLGAFSVSKMLRDTLASLERLPAARSAALSVLEPEDLRNVMKIKDVVVRTVGPEKCYSQVKGRDPAAGR